MVRNNKRRKYLEPEESEDYFIKAGYNHVNRQITSQRNDISGLVSGVKLKGDKRNRFGIANQSL